MFADYEVLQLEEQGAVLFATIDAPPMNEMVTRDRGLRVAYSRTGSQNLATTYFFDDDAMSAVIGRAMSLDDVECERIGANARAWFEENDRAFRRRIGEAVEGLE